MVWESQRVIDLRPTQVQVQVRDRRWSLGAGDSVVLGRGTDCDVVLSNDSVSREHARIDVDQHGRPMLTDLGSTNGTFVDERAIAQDRTTILRPGATIRLGAASDQAISVDIATAEQVLTIGRASDNGLRVADPELSRHHARARSRPDGTVEVEDLDSFNGTFRNGVPIRRAIVSPGDLLTMGRSQFQVLGGRLVHTIETGVELRADRLSVTVAQDRRILDDVSFVLPPGQLMAVIGPSGAGKTTLLRALTGSRPASSGIVLYGGRDLYQQYADLANRIGVVPQDDIVHRQLTVAQALGFAAQLRFPADLEDAARQHRILQVLDQLQLTERADTRVAKLSGGQRKRVSVAMELLTEPALLLLDEPTSGLDPNLDRAVMQLLRDQADLGRTVVVVTHSVASLQLCDRVLLLAPGGVVAYDGPPQQLLSHFDATDVADVFAHVVRDPQAMRARPAAAPSAVSQPPRTAVASQRRRPNPVRQFGTVLRRQWRLALADPGYAIATVALPVILALMVLAVPGSDGLAAVAGVPSGESTQILVTMMVGAAFMGAAATIRELVGERAIYLRERAVGLGIGVYLCAKVCFVMALCLVQAAILTGIVLALKPAPEAGAWLPRHGGASLELLMAIWLCALAAALLGLLGSAVVRSSEQVMPLLVVAVMAQLVLCGGLIRVTERPFLEQVSWLAPARWGFAAAAATVDAVRLDPSLPDDLHWHHDTGQWWASVACLLVLCLAWGCLTAITLRRTRPTV